MKISNRHGAVSFPPLSKSIGITVRRIGRVLIDLMILFFATQKRSEDIFAFVVHPREPLDTQRTFPLFRFLGNFAGRWIGLFIPPHVVEEIEITDSRQKGFLLTHHLTPELMTRYPKLAALYAEATVLLAAKKGASIIGLGALNPMLTQYGLRVQPKLKYSKVTIGHAYTAATIIQQLQLVSGGGGVIWPARL